jgi:hypothetical protein
LARSSIRFWELALTGVLDTLGCGMASCSTCFSAWAGERPASVMTAAAAPGRSSGSTRQARASAR